MKKRPANLRLWAIGFCLIAIALLLVYGEKEACRALVNVLIALLGGF